TEHKPKVRRRDRKERNYIWTRDSVRDLLKNAFYLGMVKYKGELLTGKHSAIITQELFDTAKRMRKEHYIGPSTHASNHRTYLLKGLLRCVSCGGKIWAQHINGYEYYREENSARGIRCPNGKAYHRVHVLDEQISKIIENLTLPESWRELVLDYLNSGEERAQTDTERHRLEEKLKRIKQQYREGDIDQREYEREMSLTKAALTAVQSPVDAQLVQLGDHIEGLIEAWTMATKEERHQLLTMMLDAVYVDMKNAEVVGIKPRSEFLPLFNLKEPVKSGEADLVITGFKQGRSIPEIRAGRIMSPTP
ncbi:MAG: recombinase family protein, partial [Chloroflexi bacterium]|nr:recombinase family protein [Chloroflexota bacterium]